MRTILASAALFAATAAPASATVVFTDNFDGENGGSTGISYSSFTNFSVAGDVDVVASGDYGITCAGGSGSCVDLDGTPGPGELTSLSSFAFNAGDVIDLSFLISGNQRGGSSDAYHAGVLFAGSVDVLDLVGLNHGSPFLAGDLGPSLGFNIFYSPLSSSDPFALSGFSFTAGNAGSLTFNIGSSSSDNVGPILDNVSLSITPGAAAVPEPATWAMMMLGLFGIGATMRSRKVKQTVSFA